MESERDFEKMCINELCDKNIKTPGDFNKSLVQLKKKLQKTHPGIPFDTLPEYQNYAKCKRTDYPTDLMCQNREGDFFEIPPTEEKMSQNEGDRPPTEEERRREDIMRRMREGTLFGNPSEEDRREGLLRKEQRRQEEAKRRSEDARRLREERREEENKLKRREAEKKQQREQANEIKRQEYKQKQLKEEEEKQKHKQEILIKTDCLKSYRFFEGQSQVHRFIDRTQRYDPDAARLKFYTDMVSELMPMSISQINSIYGQILEKYEMITTDWTKHIPPHPTYWDTGVGNRYNGALNEVLIAATNFPFNHFIQGYPFLVQGSSPNDSRRDIISYMECVMDLIKQIRPDAFKMGGKIKNKKIKRSKCKPRAKSKNKHTKKLRVRGLPVTVVKHKKG